MFQYSAPLFSDTKNGEGPAHGVWRPNFRHAGRIYSSGSRLPPKRRACEQAKICSVSGEYFLQSIFSPEIRSYASAGTYSSKKTLAAPLSLYRGTCKKFFSQPPSFFGKDGWSLSSFFRGMEKPPFFPWIANIGAVHARPFALLSAPCRLRSKAQQISAPIPVLAYDKYILAFLSVCQVSLLRERQTPPLSYSCAPASGSGACCMAISPVCPISSKTVSVAVTVTAPSSSSTWKRNPSTGRFSGISRRARL